MTDFSPREIVSELDRFIVGQTDAKRAVAIALRNRWRRKRLPENLRDEVTPKNILMIGPTGVGKTEISRRLARLAQAPFLKVEATRFTEVGYVGRDVEQIVRDLVEVAVGLVREHRRREMRARAEILAEERLISALVGEKSSEATRAEFRRRLREGSMEDKEVELELAQPGPQAGTLGNPFEMPNAPPGSMGVFNLSELLSKAMPRPAKRVRMRVSEARAPLIAEESEKLLDPEVLHKEALTLAESDGIVFIDEIDKIASRQERGGADVSREGVQRDLLPLLEGANVATKYGMVKTDHILFIASGAFQVAKPSDLLPELQGRLPIRVELKALTRDDFRRILVEPEANLIRQYIALLGAEGVTLVFTDAAVDEIAALAAEVNEAVENIGARRLHTMLERLLDDISFSAPDRAGETVTIDVYYVRAQLRPLVQNTDLSRFIL